MRTEQGCACHRIDQRHRPWHCPRPCQGRRRHRASTASATRPQSKKTRAEIAKEFGVKVTYSDADMSKPEAIAANGRRDASPASAVVDVLVNNAGIQFVSPVEEFPLEKWDQILAINLTSSFHTIRAALPGMKAQEIRAASSTSPPPMRWSPRPSRSPMSPPSMASPDLTKTVALEAAEFGITVNAVCPGYVLTPLVEKQIPDTAKARGITEEAVIRDVLLAAQPTKRFVTVEEVAALVVFLCGDRRARSPARSFPIDGGWTAH